MANYLNDLQKIPTVTLNRIIGAMEAAFHTELGIENFYGKNQTTWSIPEIGLAYKSTISNEELEQWVETLTQTDNLRNAYASIYEEIDKRKNATKEAKAPEQPAATTPDKIATQEQLEAIEGQKTETERLERIKKETEATIERKKQIIEEQKILNERIDAANKAKSDLENKKIYAKVEIPESPPLTQDEKKDLQKLKYFAAKNPQQLVNDFSDKVEKILETDKTLSVQERKVLAKQASENIVEKLNPPISYTPIYAQRAILYNINQTQDLSKKANVSKETAKTIKNGSIALALNGSEQNEKEIARLLLGDKYEERLYGPALDKIKVSFSSQKQEGFTHEVDLQRLNEDSINLQTEQSETLNTIQGLGTDQLKGYFLNRTANIIEGKIAGLPADSALKILYSSPEVRSILSTYGLARPITWEATNTFGGLIVRFSPESAPFFSAVGKLTGVDFGIMPSSIPTLATGSLETGTLTGGIATTEAITTATAAAGPAGTVAAGAAAETIGAAAGGEVVGAAVGAAEAEAVGAAVGQTLIPFPGVGAAIGIIIGMISSKIIQPLLSKAKQWWTKNKDNVKLAFTALAGLAAFRYFGPAAGLGVWGGLYFLAAGPKKMAVALLGMWLVLRRVFRNSLGSLLKGIGITFLVLPPLVALILFVINTGAYLVPKSETFVPGVVISPYIGVKKEITKVINSSGTEIKYDPKEGVPNSELPIIVTYKVTITAKKGPLSNVKISDKCFVRKESNPPSCPSPNPAIPTSLPDPISPATPYSFEFEMEFTSPDFNDTRTTNTIQVTADVTEQAGVTAAGSASLRIGDPPEDCPSDWPAYPISESYLMVTQGPHTSNRPRTTHDIIEAIDIYPAGYADFTGHPILATHTGVATAGELPIYGKFVDVTSDCTLPDGTSVTVTSRYAHLSVRSFNTGDGVNKDDQVGLAGSSGQSPNNSHLHYEFRPLPGPIPMKQPYLPVDVPVGCADFVPGKRCNIQY